MARPNATYVVSSMIDLPQTVVSVVMLFITFVMQCGMETKNNSHDSKKKVKKQKTT